MDKINKLFLSFFLLILKVILNFILGYIYKKFKNLKMF